MHLSPQVAWAAVRSKSVVLFVVDFLFIVTLIVAMFCCTLLFVHSSIAIILMGRENWLLCLICLPGVS